MYRLSRLLLLAVSGVLLCVQAAPRGSPAGAGSRRLSHKKDTPVPTPSPTRKKLLYPNVDNLNNRVDFVNDGEVDWDATPAPTTPAFQAEWGEPTPVAFDKKNPWIDIGGDGDADADDDDDADDGTEPTPTSFVFTPAPVPGVVVASPPPTPVVFDTPPPTPVPVQRTRRPAPIATPMPTLARTASPTVTPSASPTVSRSATPTLAATESPSVFSSSVPSLAPAVATFTPVALMPINFGFLGKLPTLSFTLAPSTIPSMSPTTSSPSVEPTVTTPIPTEDGTLWTPLKSFSIQFARDTAWDTQFAPEELRAGLEMYLADSFMLLSANLQNVTLSLFSSTYNDDKSLGVFQFRGKLYYEPKREGMDIFPDEVWTQQSVLLKNKDAIEWILTTIPSMSFGFTVIELIFLDASTSTQTFDGYSGASSSNLNQTTKIVIAVAAILLILACSVGVYIFMFLDTESQEPLPVIQTKFTSNMESDLSVGKELPGHNVPEVTFEQQDSHSEMSSITELRADDVLAAPVPEISSVDAIASNDSRLLPISTLQAGSSQFSTADRYRTPDMESLQLSSAEPDWSIVAGTLDPDDPPTNSALGAMKDDLSQEDGPILDEPTEDNGSVEDLYVTTEDGAK